MTSLPPNIYIVGAQSTGKTTLVGALDGLFQGQCNAVVNTHQSQPCIIKEVARSVLNKHQLTANDITASSSSALRVQRLILEAQVEVENEIRLRHQWYISDRSALDPLVYAQLYSGDDGLTELQGNPTWAKAAAWMKNSVVIVCEAGGEWLIDDGVRLMPKDEQAWYGMHESFCKLLESLSIEYTILPRSISMIEKRVEFVVNRWGEKRGIASPP